MALLAKRPTGSGSRHRREGKGGERRLREDDPEGFALDADHAPHVTLLQQCVRTTDLDEVAKAVIEALRKDRSGPEKAL